MIRLCPRSRPSGAAISALSSDGYSAIVDIDQPGPERLDYTFIASTEKHGIFIERRKTMAKKQAGKDVEVSTRKGELAEPGTSRAVNPFEEMERLFEQFMGRSWLRPFRWENPLWSEMSRPMEIRVPSVDVIDREEEIVVRAEIPGVDKENLEVSLNDDRLTIKGTTRQEKEEKEAGEYTRRDMSRGSFTRVVTLPANVDGEKAKASFRDGVLEMTLPKLKPSKRTRINVH
jgi:HSP20 family protein